MSKFSKKLVSVALSAVTVVSMSGSALILPASAQTVDLQAQINALLAQIAALQAQLGTGSSSTTACTFTRDLTLGAKGDDVTCLQNYLTSTGHFTFAVGATGYFGPITKTS